MKIRAMVVAAWFGVWMTTACFAQHEATTEIPPAPGEGEHAKPAVHEPAYPHPTLPAAGQLWAVPMLIIVGGLFLAAACVGPLHRMEITEEPADAHGHGHDDHAHDHGHGHH